MSAPRAISTLDVPPQFLKAVCLVGYVPFKTLACETRVSYSSYIPELHYILTQGETAGKYSYGRSSTESRRNNAAGTV